MRTKWEYHYQTASSLRGFQLLLPSLGEDGWELVTVTKDRDTNNVTMILKREKEKEPAEKKEPFKLSEQ